MQRLPVRDSHQVKPGRRVRSSWIPAPLFSLLHYSSTLAPRLAPRWPLSSSPSVQTTGGAPHAPIAHMRIKCDAFCGTLSSTHSNTHTRADHDRASHPPAVHCFLHPQYIRTKWPWWDRHAGARHLIIQTGDTGRTELGRGAFRVTENATFLTHWGLTSDYKASGWRASHRPLRDVVVPIYMWVTVHTGIAV